jgi:hypothetical protein
MTIYQNPDRDRHQLNIVGNSNISDNIHNQEAKLMEKELKQRRHAEELKKQIEERDHIRRKEDWRKTRAQAFVAGTENTE